MKQFTEYLSENDKLKNALGMVDRHAKMLKDAKKRRDQEAAALPKFSKEEHSAIEDHAKGLGYHLRTHTGHAMEFVPSKRGFKKHETFHAEVRRHEKHYELNFFKDKPKNPGNEYRVDAKASTLDEVKNHLRKHLR